MSRTFRVVTAEIPTRKVWPRTTQDMLMNLTKQNGSLVKTYFMAFMLSRWPLPPVLVERRLAPFEQSENDMSSCNPMLIVFFSDADRSEGFRIAKTSMRVPMMMSSPMHASTVKMTRSLAPSISLALFLLSSVKQLMSPQQTSKVGVQSPNWKTFITSLQFAEEKTLHEKESQHNSPFISAAEHSAGKHIPSTGWLNTAQIPMQIPRT